MNSEIWFDLCVGTVRVSEEGRYLYKPSFSRLSQISTLDVKDVAKYRELLHKQLDQAIDHISEIQKLGAAIRSLDGKE